MNQGVQMLLARMDSHPEEFSPQFGADGLENRWVWVMDDVQRRVCGRDLAVVPLPFLSDEEAQTLYDKFVALQGDAFTQYVMRELLGADSEVKKRGE